MLTTGPNYEDLRGLNFIGEFAAERAASGDDRGARYFAELAIEKAFRDLQPQSPLEASDQLPQTD